MRIFVTGGTGFIGSSVLPRLVEQGHTVTALTRSAQTGSDVQWVIGDLERPESFEQHLADQQCVIHMAALTGKAPAARHDRVNREATLELIGRCGPTGVGRFVFLSTVAVSYPEKKNYPYARAKEAAEQALSQSGLPFVTLRPTLVMGPNSPIEEALAKLAGLPLTPLFGNGKTRVQPVHVDDVAEAVVRAVSDETWTNRVLNLGGPESLSFDELMQKLRKRAGKSAGPLLHIPAGLVQSALSLMEPALLPVLPLTAGQIYAFRYDSTVDNQDFEPKINLKAMLQAHS